MKLHVRRHRQRDGQKYRQTTETQTDRELERERDTHTWTESKRGTNTNVTDSKDQTLSHTRSAFLPMSTAPRTSKTVPRMQACASVRTPAPTDDPKELATSFAPMPKARTKATMKPTTTIHSHSSGMPHRHGDAEAGGGGGGSSWWWWFWW